MRDLTKTDAELITMYHGITRQDLETLGTMLDDAMNEMVEKESQYNPPGAIGLMGSKGYTGQIGALGFKPCLFSNDYAKAGLHSSALLHFIKLAMWDHWDLIRVYESNMIDLPLLINEGTLVERAFVRWRLQTGY